jgi:gamma-glutamylcyclotransferase (GGCT)/AIG2-like uncharacterized protein YtfP
MPLPLFVYGTLLDDVRVRKVAGRTFRRRPAVLAGHRRVWPPDGYPSIVADAGASVAGDLLDGIDGAALAAFDAYEDEGRLYRREEVTVTCGDAAVRCFVYRSTAAARLKTASNIGRVRRPVKVFCWLG